MRIVKIGLAIVGVLLCLAVRNNSGYDGGLIFYDPITKHKLLPPIVTSSKLNGNIRLPFIGQPCSCTDYQCGCCAGMQVDYLNFNQRMCANITYNPGELEVVMDVHLNDKNIIMYKLSAHNPPPFCIPVQLFIPVNLCMKVSDLYTMGSNMHLCMDWMVKVWSNEIFVLHFNCVQLGTDGVEFLKPNGQQFVDTQLQQMESSSEQVNSHVFDHVDLDRRSIR